MRISFLLPHVFLSGGVKALLEYANRLQAMGCAPQLIVPAPKPKWYRLDEKALRLTCGAQSQDPGSVDWFDNRVPLIQVPEIASRYLPPADVLIASSWETAYAASSLPSDRGEKFYFIQHHEILWTRYVQKAKATYRMPFKKLVISSWLKQILKDEYGEESHLLTTPVDDKQFYPGDGERSGPAKRVCLMHHNYDWKGFQDGARAFSLAKSRGAPVELVVFGGKLEQPEPLFREMGFECEYHYRPLGKRLREIFSSCDIYLCPSWHEGLGMPPMEAMACGCALVTTDTGGCRDYALPGKTALVSAPHDVEALAKNLAALANDESLLTRLAMQGRQKIQEFNWERNCETLAALFKQSLEARRP